MIVAAVSFFLLLFLSLRRAVEMWETPQARPRPWLRIFQSTTRWLTVDIRARAKAGEGMHTQMLSFEDSAIRNAFFR